MPLHEFLGFHSQNVESTRLAFTKMRESATQLSNLGVPPIQDRASEDSHQDCPGSILKPTLRSSRHCHLARGFIEMNAGFLRRECLLRNSVLSLQIQPFLN